MKKTVITLILILTLFLTGCYGYKVNNKLILITSVLVDIDDDNKPLVYLEGFRGISENGKNKIVRLVFKGTGESLYDALEDLSLSSGYALDYSQNKVIIYSKRVIEKGIEDYIDMFDRRIDFLLRNYLVIFEGDCEKLFETELKEEKFLGIYLYNLFRNTYNPSELVYQKLNNFLNRKLYNEKINYIPIISLEKQVNENKINITKTALIKQYKFVDELDGKETRIMNLMINNMGEDKAIISNPDHTEKKVSLKSFKNGIKTKTKIKYENNNVYLKKTINIKAIIMEAQQSLNLTEKNIKKMELSANEKLEKECLELFNNLKAEGIDILNVKEELYKKYPKVKLENILSNTTLEVEVNYNINKYPVKTSFY